MATVDIYYSPGVGQEIWHVENSAVLQRLGDGIVGQRIVRRPRNDSTFDAFGCALVDYAGDCARRKDIAVDLSRGRVHDDLCAQLGRESFYSVAGGVCQREPCAGFRQVPREAFTDMTDALNEDVDVCEAFTHLDGGYCCPDGVQNPRCG